MSSNSNTNERNLSSSCSARSKHSTGVFSQISIDAKLHDDFEESDGLNTSSIDCDTSPSTSNVPSSTVSAYLRKMQRASRIQPFGCLIAVDEQNFTIFAYSENAPEMFDQTRDAVPSIEHKEALTFGTHIRTLFQSSSVVAVQKAANLGEVNLLNPILVHCITSGKPLYAILHRIDVGLVIDLEPVSPADSLVTASGPLNSYKLAAKAISRLQSLSSGNISLLCNVLVQEVRDLTDYDRVMVYKFHDDEHGEVVAELHRPDLEPCLGLHYPATDIPQASRFLFMKNKVRMICDCLALPVKVVQDTKLTQPLSLCGSTLRSPHRCHAQYMSNMGSIASLVMSITIDEDNDETSNGQKKGRKLWGLVICHHTSPRFLPFPLRYACEFLIQVFSVQIHKEVELAAEQREKHILQIQTVLCDMLLVESPVGIVTQSPNVMDLVRCNGAALYYRNKFWLLGITPTEPQIRNIVEWLLKCHHESTGLTTDSLVDAGYPGGSVLGDAVCGMAAVKISSNDFLFWFRSHTAKEIKWGGARHDTDDKREMHPRSSFKAFLEVVKRRSLPWEDVEMDAIHSLQLILRGSLQDGSMDRSKRIVTVQSVETSIQLMAELPTLTKGMVRLIETALVPVLAVDASGMISGWNTKVSELTGLAEQEAYGMPLLDLVAESSIEAVRTTLLSAFQGVEEKDVEIKLKTFGHQDHKGPLIMVANACCTRNVKNAIVGVFFVGQDITRKKLIMDKYMRIQGDYVGIMQNPCALIPPIFMMDEHGRCLDWNNAMQKLTGVNWEETIDRMVIGEVFTSGNYGCRVKGQDTLIKLRILLNGVLADQDVEKLLFGFFDRQGTYIEALLSANRRTNPQGRITGVLCFLHVASPELQYALQLQKISEQAAGNSLAKLSYIRSEIKNPLNGIKFVQNLMKSSDLSEEQGQLLNRSSMCWAQLAKIIDDTDIESFEECYMEVKSCDFNLRDAMEVVKNQVMILSHERQVEVICDLPSEASCLYLNGDNLRLQQVLSEFLSIALVFSPAFEGSSVLFKLFSRKKRIGTKLHVINLEFRIIHPAPGVPEELIQQMFHHSRSASREGLGLYISQKIVKIMNGTVQYLREAESSSFIILIELPLAHKI